ncbi:MAG: molybdopterin molybdotransferase MoeA [Gemmatimonadaceae bacterium]|nr:molybdopterin molybdotransferase MoeA [Gemmatimonadaceae bacterium]
MLSVEEAAARITTSAAPLDVETVELLDAAGRVLAESIIAPITLPHWDNSAMDGYAVRAADIAGASASTPVTLPVQETIAAGAFPTLPVMAGTATRIMTGAPMPSGADTVVRVEDTDGGIEQVSIRDARDVQKNVRPRGEDIREGDVLLAEGQPLAAAQIGVLASCGIGTVPVYRRPRVAIISSGDELVDLDRFDEVRAGRRIVSSNRYTLTALIRDAGGIPVDLGIAADTPESLRATLTQAMTGFDLIITTAGISVGEFDHTRAVLADLGATLDFWKIRMRPGAPVGSGRLGGTPWIGLPGNPVSTMVTFELFVRPAIRRMLGHRALHRVPVDVRLAEPVRIGARLTHFLRAIVAPGADGVLQARLTGPQGSGILTSMSTANALLIVPVDRPEIAVGELAHALLLDDAGARREAFTL